MIFHTFGNDSGKAILLIHGMLNPWQIWKEVSDAFSNEYFVIIPELDAHTQEEASEFISVDDEAVKICDYLQKKRERKSLYDLRIVDGRKNSGCTCRNAGNYRREFNP